MGSEGEPPNFPCFICEPHPLKKEIYALAQFKYFVINQRTISLYCIVESAELNDVV